MRTTKIQIKNILGITERKLDGKSIEITGPKGTGKTSVIDAIRFALTNRSDREWIIRTGAEEGEILIETDSGLSIERKARTNKTDSIKVKDGHMLQNRPAEFLNGIFTPLQLDPVAFTLMSKEEKNRVILSLIEYEWDTNWIKEQFGEIPQGIDYSKHILEVLADIQAEKGLYFTSRQDINRDIRNKLAFIEDIGRTLPENFQYDKWNNYDMGAKYKDLETKRTHNGRVEKAKAFTAAYDNKLRGIEADRDIGINTAEKLIADEKSQLKSTIERLKAEIKSSEEKLLGLADKLEDKKKVFVAEYNEAKAKLDADTNIGQEWADKKLYEVTDLANEIETAEAMRKHLNEYKRMISMQADIEKLKEDTDELTRKIEIARTLPGKILKTATIPVKGLTVENGVPLIEGLPVSNRSSGELLELCVDVTIQRPGGYQIILLDKIEGLDTKSREALYAKCKEKGLQIIATRVTDDEEIEIVEL